MLNKSAASAVLAIFSLPLFLALTGCVTTPSHKYPAGTVGRLYEECRDAIQYNHIPQEYIKTECAQFPNIWASGFFLAAMKNHHGDAYRVANQSCEAEIEAEGKAIKDRFFCKNSDGEEILPVTEASFGYTIARWGEWLEFYDREMLAQPIFPYINEAFHNGPFCKYMLESNLKDSSIKPSKRLLNASRAEWKEADKIWEENAGNQVFLITGKNPPSRIYKKCLQNIESANGNSLFFSGTQCGKDMSAFMSGLFFTDVVDSNNKPKDSCTEDRENFYKHEILTKDACMTKNMNILDFTKDILAGYTYDPVTDQVERKEDSLGYCKMTENKN